MLILMLSQKNNPAQLQYHISKNTDTHLRERKLSLLKSFYNSCCNYLHVSADLSLARKETFYVFEINTKNEYKTLTRVARTLSKKLNSFTRCSCHSRGKLRKFEL